MKNIFYLTIIFLAATLSGCSFGGDKIIIKDHTAYYASDTSGVFQVGATALSDTTTGDSLSFTLPVVKTRVEPQYPRLANRIGVEGELVIRAWVGSDGLVKKAMVVPEERTPETLGNGYLEGAALRAGMGWTFIPATYNGKPIPYAQTIRFDFKLIGDDPRFDSPDFDFKSLSFVANDTCALRAGYSVPEFETDPVIGHEKSGVSVQPSITKLVKPKYPRDAQVLGIEGRVVVKMYVSKTGEVIYASIVKTLNFRIQHVKFIRFRAN